MVDGAAEELANLSGLGGLHAASDEEVAVGIEKLAGIGGVAVDPVDLAAAAHAREEVVGGDGQEEVEAPRVGAG